MGLTSNNILYWTFNGLFVPWVAEKSNDGTHATFAKFSRSFREVFAKFSQVFRSFRRFGDVLGPVRTYSDAFGHVRIRSEAFGSVRTFSEFFGFVQHFSRLCQIPAKPVTKCVLPRRRKSPKCALSSCLVVCCLLLVALQSL